jgi:hypothetical protein
MTERCSHALIAGAAVLLLMSAAGCSTQAKRVDCDGDLKPINRPAPPSVPTPSKESRPNDEK